MPTTVDLANRLTAFIEASAEPFWRRFFPENRIPRLVAGVRTFEGTRSAVFNLLPALGSLGVEEIGGSLIRDLIAREMGRVVGADCKTWWSLYVAEALVQYGTPFSKNPLVAELNEAQCEQLRIACDTTRVVDVDNGVLIGHPNNYWFVVARCERARIALDLTDDTTVYDLAIANCRRVLSESPCGFMDDSEEGRGRYDRYAAHGLGGVMEFEELSDLRPLFARAWESLLLAAVRPDGGALAWGRSGGPVTALGDLNSLILILEAGLAEHRERLAGVASRSVNTIINVCWADDAITSHRHRRPHWYLGPGRILEGSCNFLATAARSAAKLRAMPPVEIDDSPEALDADRDVFIQFDPRGPGVWCLVQGKLKAQVPLVDGFTSDYVAAPVWPGLFEQICDRGMPCGVPVVEIGGKRWLPVRRPEDVYYEPGKLSWRTPCWSHMVGWDWWRGAEDRPGERRVTLTVDGSTLVGEEEWVFDETPDAVGFWFGESLTPFQVSWDCPHEHQAITMVVDGMADWHSHYHPIRKLHQIDIEPAKEMKLHYRIGPASAPRAQNQRR